MNYKELYKFINKLYYQYFRFKYNLTKEEKQDMVQDVVLSIFVKENENKLSSNIEDNKNYIFISIRNWIIDKKSRKKYTHQEYIDNFDEECLISPNDIEHQLNREMLLNQLKSTLNQIVIREDQLEIFNLRLNGISNKEIMELHGVSKYQIRNSIYGTIIKLHDEMEKKHYWKVYRIDRTLNTRFYKNLKDAATFTGSSYFKIKKLISQNGYVIINGWKIFK